jgi:hypothetical protein
MIHSTKLNITHTIRRLLVFCAFMGVFDTGQLFSQNIKTLGGTQKELNCGCADSLGNIYVVTKSNVGDTTIVNKWNATGKTWSTYATLPEMLYTYQNYNSQCFFLGNRMYIAGKFAQFSSYFEIYEVNGSAMTLRGRMHNTGTGDIKSIKFAGKMYFAGMLDSVTGLGVSRQVAIFNGTGFSASGLPGAYVHSGPSKASLEVSNDTLFTTYRKSVYWHKAPNSWGIYYNSQYELSSVASAGLRIHVSDDLGNISAIRQSATVDSFFINKPQVILEGLGKHLFFTHSKSTYDYSVRFGELVNGKPVYYFHNTLPDTTDMSFIRHNNQKLYYYSRDGIIEDGKNYNRIVEVRADSLDIIPLDTVLVRVFKDRNRNYAFDTGGVDLNGTFYVREIRSRDIQQTDNSGFLRFYPMHNEDYNLVYDRELLSGPDSCYEQSFTGARASRTYNSSRYRDTLLFPLWRKTVQNNNLVLKSWTSNRARLLDTIPLTIDVYHKDCNVDTAAATIRVNLDSNTVFISCTPGYVSKNGNELVFSLKVGANAIRKIKINVVYPNTKYTLNQLVRHRVLLTTTFPEDTLDNSDSIVQRMTYSYDPNAKHCIPEGVITKEVKSVRYHIDFQNLGNDVARRVTIVDTLNLKMPVYEFRMITSSHNYATPTIRGNVLTWVFDNINLQAKSKNEPASKGYLIFEARVKSELKVGDTIKNKAHIYFDYNSPVVTNYAFITRHVNHPKGIDPPRVPYTLIVFPNPATDQITIDINFIGRQEVCIYDTKGSLVHRLSLSESVSGLIDTSGWARGIYIVVSSSGESVKVVIE